MTKQTKTTKPVKREGDGHTDAGTDLFFIGVDAVFGDPQGQSFNLRDPRQVEKRLRQRAERAK